MENIIYSKFSSERAKQFSIRTHICVNDTGKKYVKKVPSTADGLEYVSAMPRHYECLKQQFEGSVFVANYCEQKEGFVEFEYIDGVSLDVMLNELIEDDNVLAAEKLIKRYVEEIHNLYDNADFEMTEQFEDIFGSYSFPTHTLGSVNYNVDLIFSNIIINKDIWNVLDYEWIFEFPIPTNFVIYRAIFYYFLENPNSKDVLGDDIYKKVGLTEEEIKVYSEMDKAFQCYTKGGRYTLHEWMGDNFGNNIISLKDILDSQNVLFQIYFDYGYGILEELSKVYECKLSQDKCVKLCIEIPDGVKKIRIDPTPKRAIIFINDFNIITDDKTYKAEYYTNGKNLTDSCILFNVDDAQIYVSNFIEGSKSIDIFYRIDYLTETSSSVMDCCLETLSNEKAELNANINLLNNQICLLSGDLNKSKEETERLGGEAERLNNEMNSLNASLNELNQIINSQNASLDELNRIINSQNNLIVGLEEQKHSLEILVSDQASSIQSQAELIRQKQLEIESIYNSTSWKLTKPVRKIGSVVRKNDIS